MAVEVNVTTQSSQMARVLSTNSAVAATSIANPATSFASPGSGQTTGVITMGAGSEFSNNGLLLIPYGVGSATNTFLMSVFAWDFVHPVVTQRAQVWVAWLLASFTCTLNTVAGLAGGEVDETQLFCGTIALVSGNANISNEIVSPTGNLIASIVLDTKGAKMVQPLFARNASATSANAIYRRM